MSILYVDDDRMMLDCIKSALIRDGFDVATTTNPEVALDLMDATTFDLIITDFNMPIMDGIEFTKRARQKNSKVPIWLFTGDCFDDTVAKFILAGGNKTWPKINAATMLRAIPRKSIEKKDACL